MHAWCSLQHGDVETGSTYNTYKLGCEQDKDAILRASDDVLTSGTLTDIEICMRSAEINMATSKPEIFTS